MKVDFGNIVLEDDHVVYGENGRIKGRITYDEMKEIELIKERRKRWFIAFSLGILLVAIPTLLLIKFGVAFYLEEYAMNIATSFAILSGYALFFLLGISGIQSVSKKYFLLVNGKIKFEVLKKQTVERWVELSSILAEKDIRVISHLKDTLPNHPQSHFGDGDV